MKKMFLLLYCLFTYSIGNCQFSVDLAGYPLTTTGWNTSTEGYALDSEFVITDPIDNQASYIYYDSAVNLTTCSQFTVKFDFQIAQDPAGDCIADGIAFWYISNPPSGFTTGSGIGLPNLPHGYILILDTYDNNGDGNNPLATMLGDPGTFNYVEGSSTGVLGSVDPYQYFIDDGSWHHCEVDYNAGTIKVYFNYSTTPAITGTYALSLTGYFGFSASTGACVSTQSIKNVHITATGVSATPTVISPVTFCQGSVTVPADTLTATGTNLQWFTTDTATVTSIPGPPIPSTATADTTYYYVRSGTGSCISPPDSVEVIVNPYPASPVISGDTLYCNGATPTPFTVTGTGTALWYTTDAGGTGSTTPTTIITTTSGDHTYYASELVSGCESARDSITVDVLPAINPSFAYTLHLGCTQDTLVLTNTSTAASTYSWDFGDGSAASTAPNTTHIYTTQGTYNVQLTAYNSLLCSASITKPINTNHPIQAAFHVSPDTVCLGQSVLFVDGSTGGGLTYIWNYGDGTNLPAPFSINPSKTYTASGTYTASVTITDTLGCLSTATENVYIIDFSINTSFHDTTVCLRGPMPLVTEVNIFPDVTNNVTFTWAPSDSLSADSVQTPTFYGLGNYTYTVTAVLQPLGCTSTDVLTIHSIAAIPLTNVTTDQTIPYGSSVQLYADGAVLYLWTPDNGSLNNPNINDPIATPTEPTTYVVYGTNNLGCTDSATVKIDIDYGMNIYIPSAFSPNNDGLNDKFHALNVKYEKVMDFRVYNRWGQQVFQGSDAKQGWDGTFNGVPQDMGVYNYIMVVSFPDGTERTYTGSVTLVR